MARIRTPFRGPFWVAFLAVFLMATASMLHAENACTFQLSNGTANFLKKDTSKLISIGADPVEIVIGDRLISGQETRGNLTFPDGSVFRMKSNTTLELINEGVKLQVGEALFQLQKQGRNFQVVTPSSVCGVLGTMFDVNVDGNGKSRIRVFEGVVDVRSREDQKRQTLLRAGQMIEAQKRQPLPEAPKSFDARKIMQEDKQYFQRGSGMPIPPGGGATRNPQSCGPNPNNPNLPPVPNQGQGNPLMNNAPGNSPQGDPRNPMLGNPRQGAGEPTRDQNVCSSGQTKNPLLCGNGQPQPGSPGNSQGMSPTADPRMCRDLQPRNPQGNDPRATMGGMQNDASRDKRQCQSFETTNPLVCQGTAKPPTPDGNQRPTQDPRACMNPGSGRDPSTNQGANTSNPLQCRQDQNLEQIQQMQKMQQMKQGQPNQLQSKPLMTQDPRLCNSQPTIDPKLCQGAATSNPLSCREKTRNPQECQLPQTQDPRACQAIKPTTGQPGNPAPSGIPGSTNPQNPGTKDPLSCQAQQPETSNPRVCQNKQTLDPRQCQTPQTQDPRLCQVPQTQDPRICAALSTKYPRLCRPTAPTPTPEGLPVPEPTPSPSPKPTPAPTPTATDSPIPIKR